MCFGSTRSQVGSCITIQVSLKNANNITEYDKYALGRVTTSAGVAADPQFQAISYTISEVYAPAGARNSSADVAELVDAHV